ncbi:hypothetical protein [Massilia sp. Root335]|uniref:hypothetical protein n=1 Tax=Massilia sp. Root335 TaxID=1736517 RepID=UPI0007153944|nr:hypothetical protein [Massilia sp. Root335]KQV46368.1 hypothetical protein ASC93_14660 [Massilia sp. Root335]
MKLMAAARPGSTRWLIQHELRLAWRGSDKRRRVVVGAVLAALWLALHVGAYVLFRRWSGATGTLPAWTAQILGGATWLVIGVMLSGAVAGSVSALFDRGDLDMLLSSPLPARTVFMARGLGIAADAGKTLLFLLSPVVNVGVLFGYWNLLAVYLTLPSLALAVTALGMNLCLVLVRLVGARRTRSLGKILGTMVTTATFLLFQLRQIFDATTTEHLVAALTRWAAPGGPLAPDSLLWLPSQAMGGAPLPVLVMFVAGPGIFWLTVRLTHHRFLAGTQESVTGSAVRTLATPQSETICFKSALWQAVLRKEWRLIRREPVLISQTLMQLTFVVVPVVYSNVQQNADSATLMSLLGPLTVYLAASLAGSLAWITIAAEDVPELLHMAPVSLSRLRWMKALAALLPTWVLALPAVAFITTINLPSVPGLLLCLVGGTVSVVATHIWYPIQATRADLARGKPGRGAVTPIAAFVTLAWVISAFWLAEARASALSSLLAATLGSSAIWMLGRARRADERDRTVRSR